MKIETIDAKDIVPGGLRQKYADLYTQIDALPDGKALRLTVDEAKDLAKMRNAIQGHYPSDALVIVSNRERLQVSIAWKAGARPPAPDPKP